MRFSFAATLFLLCLTGCTPPHQPGRRLTLWAWERPDDLRFLPPHDAGVAVLLGTLRISGDRLEIAARRNRLDVNPDTTLTPVIRIEVDPAHPTALRIDPQRAVDAIATLTNRPNLHGLQIDFDARISDRDFERRLLAALHRRHRPLSVTALASWCWEDGWLETLPVDEVVPMLFRMGPDAARFYGDLRRRGQFPQPVCRGSLGVAVDEPLPWYPKSQHIYIFNSKPWTTDEFLHQQKQLP